MKKRLSQFMALILIVLMSACDKDNSANTAQVNMRLTDGPAVYDHVYIDIQQVEVTVEGSSAVTLAPIHAGVYDILSFRNGLDTLLMRATLPAGKVNQIRLILGSNNSLVVNGTSYPLNTPSAQESGLKLNFNQTLEAGGSYDIWIDFDAAKSILKTGNGSYKLKPVIRAYSASTNGQIRGYVLPLNASAIVYAANGTDTLTAIPNSIDGFFKISGMASGSYQLWVTPGITGLLPYTQAGIQVTYGAQVDLGTITLHP